MTKPVLFRPLSVTYSTCFPTRLSGSSPGFLSAGSRCLFSGWQTEKPHDAVLDSIYSATYVYLIQASKPVTCRLNMTFNPPPVLATVHSWINSSKAADHTLLTKQKFWTKCSGGEERARDAGVFCNADYVNLSCSLPPTFPGESEI